jgi:predicted ribosomally synthesized peptide with nif11-like leader
LIETSLELKSENQEKIMSKAQLTAFLAKVEITPALKLQVDGASDGSAVVAIAEHEGFHFSQASLARHLRG